MNIALPEEIKGEATIYIKNEMGQLIAQQRTYSVELLKTIDVNSFVPGLYLVQIIANGKSVVGRTTRHFVVVDDQESTRATKDKRSPSTGNIGGP